MSKASKRVMLACVSSLALAAGFAKAGEITGVGAPTGDGFLFIDETENISPPGAKVVTNVLNNDDFTSDNGFAPNNVANCLMANAPADISCDAPPGSGKRIKANTTGPAPFDQTFTVRSTGGVTEYFTFGKLTNQTGKRILGFRLVLGKGTGRDFKAIDPSSPLARSIRFDGLTAITPKAAEWPGLGGKTTGQNPLQRVFLPDGLFGNGGQEGDIGFFSDERAGFVLVQTKDGLRLLTDGLFDGADDAHLINFGDGLLDRSQVPEAIFFDDDGDPSTESKLVAWLKAGVWVDGDGNPVSAADLRRFMNDPAFETGIIEDLSNLNLNYSIDVGDLPEGAFTLRLVPIFAPIVEVAETELQDGVATSLDNAAIPFLGASSDLTDATAEVLALPSAAAQRNALERLGFSFAGAYGDLAYAMGRAQMLGAIGDVAGAQPSGGAVALAPDDGTMSSLSYGGGGVAGAAAAVASQNIDADWMMGETHLFLSGGLSFGDRDREVNGAGFDFTTWNVTAGAGYEIDPGVTIGAALGYTGADADIDDGRGDISAEGLAAMLFAKTEFAGGGWLNAGIGYQFLDFDTERNISVGAINRTASSDADGGQFFVAARGGWDFTEGALTWGPVASGEVTVWDVDGFTETGAGGLNMTVGDQDGVSLRGSLGLRAAYEMKQSWGVVSPNVHLGVAARSGDDNLVSTGFVGPISAFTVPVDGGDDVWLEAGAGVSAYVYDGDDISTVVSLAYEGALFGGDYEEHRGMLRLSFRF